LIDCLLVHAESQIEGQFRHHSRYCNIRRSVKPAMGRRVLAVGPTQSGKTMLLVRFTKNWFEKRPEKRDDHFPHQMLVYSNEDGAETAIEGAEFTLDLLDSNGSSDYDRLRPLSYARVDVFLLCFRVDRRDSLRELQEKFLPEIRAAVSASGEGNDPHFLLCGCQADLRDPNNIDGRTVEESELVFAAEAKEKAVELGCEGYVECSAATGDGVAGVFATAVQLLVASSPEKKGSCLLQ
jgi:Rho family, other